MNILSMNCIMVAVISNNFIETLVTGHKNLGNIQRLGFSEAKDRFIKNICNENEKQNVINENY